MIEKVPDPRGLLSFRTKRRSLISVLDLKKSNQIKSNQIQNIQRFDLDLKSFLTQ
jgi:hypothetical protein